MLKNTINQLLVVRKTEDEQQFQQLIQVLSTEFQRLQDRIAYLERQLYGKKSETQRQSTTIETISVFDVTEQDEVSVYLQEKTVTYHREKPMKKRSKRLELSTLPRREVIHDLAEDERYCDCCHQTMSKFSEDRSTKVEMIPSQYIAVEHVLVNYACHHCGQVKRANKKQSAIPKSLVGNGIIAKVVVDKYMHHLPIYRQSLIYKQQGFKVDDPTIGRWTMKLAESLQPIKAALWEQVVQAPYLQVDETPVLCVEQKKKCYMWSYAAFHDKKRPSLVLFDFQITRGSASVNERLKYFEGILQTDGYAGYNALRTQPGIIGLGCGAHIRRKFFDVASSSQGSSSLSEKVLSYFRQLYAIEEASKEMSFDQRRIYRQNNAKPILSELYQWLQKIALTAIPKSTLSKAIHYALDEWSAWSEYINQGQAEIDTNWVENQIRPFAVGRRNWLFIGNQQAGEHSALLYSLTHSARLNDIDPWSYLFYLADHVHLLRKNQISPKELLPHRVSRDAVSALKSQYLEEMISLFKGG